MKRFRKPFLVPIYLEVEISDEEIKELRKEILDDLDDADEYTEQEINDAVNEYLDDILWDKFSDAKNLYERKNDVKLEETDDWDIEEI